MKKSARALVFAFLFLLPALSIQAATPVVLDTDIGDDIDDALALAFLLQSPEIDVRAVTTVLNRGDVRVAIVWRMLELYHRTDIPIGIGSEVTLLGKPDPKTPVQSAALPAGFTAPSDKAHPGIELLADTLLKSKQKMTVVAIGPLTDIALLLRTEPRVREHIERIVLMSGVFFQAGLEYNVYRDPEAAAIVYSSGLPISTVGLDVTLKCQLTLDQVKQMADSKLPNVAFLYSLIHAWQGGDATRRPILHDPLAAMTLVEPSLVDNQTGTVEVETKGTVGVSYGLSTFHQANEGNTKVAQHVDSGKAVDLFISRVVSAPRQ